MENTDEFLSPRLQSPNQPSLDQILQKKFEEVFSSNPGMQPDEAFYLEICKLHLNYARLNDDILKVQEEIYELKDEIGLETFQKKKYYLSAHGSPHSEQNNSELKRRKRRTAVEIARHYVCEVEKCNKSYGSEGSLHQHMKLKHPNAYAKNMLMINFVGNNA